MEKQNIGLGTVKPTPANNNVSLSFSKSEIPLGNTPSKISKFSVGRNSVASLSAQCGLGTYWAPKGMQRFRNRFWVLTVLCAAFILQQAVSNGFPSVVFRTLEIRYGFSSWQIGVLSTCYEIADTVICVFLVHFIANSSKPVSVGIGLLFVSVGGLVFCLPQFISDIYNPGKKGIEDQCTNTTQFEPTECHTSSEVYGYDESAVNYSLFMIGMLIVGAGSVPMHSFVPTYIDENVESHEVAMYHSIWFSLGILGPAIGFMGGGMLLKIPTDFYRIDDEMDMPVQSNPDSPAFVGAWWVGILASSVLLFVVALLVICLPRKFGHGGESHDEVVATPSSEDFMFTCKTLFTNNIWILTVFANGFDAFMIQICAGFAVRHVALTFRLSNSLAAILGGSILIVSAVSGQLAAGIFLRRLESVKSRSEQIKQLAYSTLVGPFGSLLFSFHALLRCGNPTIHGVDFSMQSQSLLASATPALLNTSCVNTNCPSTNEFFSCDIGNFAPLCDVETQTTFYSACFAGCDKNGTNCACLENPSSGDISSEFCEACGNTELLGYCLMLGALLACVFWNVIPYTQLVIRSVPYSQRSQAVAWWSVVSRLIGSIPGPIIFGPLLDSACVVWEPAESKCIDGTTIEPEYDAVGSCMLFDATKTSHLWLLMFLTTRILCAISISLLTYFAKKSADEESSRDKIPADTTPAPDN